MGPRDKATADSRSVQSFAAGHWNFVTGRHLTLELELDYPSETSLKMYSRPIPPQTPLLRFFLRGGGGCTQAI